VEKLHILHTEMVSKIYSDRIMLIFTEAYFAMTELYQYFGTMSTKDFNQLVDKSNQIGQILLSHYIAFHVIAYPVIAYESSHRDLGGLFSSFFSWSKNIHSRLPPAFKPLNEWPVQCMTAFSAASKHEQTKMKY
jgi:hypothetical protein